MLASLQLLNVKLHLTYFWSPANIASQLCARLEVVLMTGNAVFLRERVV